MRVDRVGVKYKQGGFLDWGSEWSKITGKGGRKKNNLQEVRGFWRPLLPSANILHIV